MLKLCLDRPVRKARAAVTRRGAKGAVLLLSAVALASAFWDRPVRAAEPVDIAAMKLRTKVGAPDQRRVPLAGSGIALPLEIGELRYRKSIGFRSRGLGEALEYAGAGIVATVYVYNLGRKKIPPGPQSGPAEIQFQHAIRHLHTLNRHRKIRTKRVGAGQLKVGEAKGEVFNYAVFSLTKADVTSRADVYAGVYLTVYRNHFVKVRTTFVSKIPPARGGVSEDFVRQLAQSLKAPPSNQPVLAALRDRYRKFDKAVWKAGWVYAKNRTLYLPVIVPPGDLPTVHTAGRFEKARADLCPPLSSKVWRLMGDAGDLLLEIYVGEAYFSGAPMLVSCKGALRIN